MFSDHSLKRVPKTLNDCIKPDGVSSNLWIWAEKLEKFGYIFLVLIIIFGFINTIYLGVTTFQLVSEIGNASLGSVATVFVVLTSLSTCAILAFLEYCAYHAIALLIGSLASIVQNTNISANLALYGIKGKSGDKFTEEPEQKKSEKNTVQNEDNRIDINILNMPSDDIAIDEIVEENFIDIKCPHCGKELSFPESSHDAICPYCNNSFQI